MSSNESEKKRSAQLNIRLRPGSHDLMQTVMQREFRSLSDIVRISLFEHIQDHHPDLEEEARKLLGPGN